MGRNEFCWCGSKKKWKHCHYNRDQQKPINVFEAFAEYSENFKRGFCLFPIANQSCNEKPIKSHTIQKNGGLYNIAENNHVLSCKHGLKNVVEKRVWEPKETGISKASIFYGFCQKHDHELFLPIESGYSKIGIYEAFLFSYRAVCLEYMQKYNAVNFYEYGRDMDKGKNYSAQCYIQTMMHASHVGNMKGLEDAMKWKEIYDKSYLEKNFSSFKGYSIVFDGVLPIVACGGFFPEMDFSGNVLQSLGTNKFADLITFTITSFQNKSILTIGGLIEDGSAAHSFLNQVKDIDPNSIGNISIKIAAEYIENIFLRKSWWDNLSDELKGNFKDRVFSGIGLSNRLYPPDFIFSRSFQEDGHLFYSANVDEVYKFNVS